jgi:hypothetical protein
MTFQSFLRGLVAVLAVLLLLVLAGYFVLQRYLIYTDSGARLELPFLSLREDPEGGDTLNVIVEDGSAAGQEDQASADTAQTETQPTRAVWLPLSALDEGTVQTQVASAGGNAVVLDMKGTDGLLAYHSDQALADRAGANFADEDGSRASALQALNESGLYTVARVACFQDNRLSYADWTMNILTNSGYVWTDQAGVRWTSPARAEVRDYLTAIAVELAQMGFDEILLDWAGYPTDGQLGWIRVGDAYPTGALDEVIGPFYEQVAQALAPYDAKLSIRTTAQALAGTDDLTGQTAANLTAWADRIWVAPAEGLDPAALLQAAGVERPEERLVLLVDGFSEGAEDQAVLP